MNKNTHHKPQFMIAAPTSGAGKTTLTLGLLRAISRREFSVQPFKCGPDYIDTKHHETAAGRASINLDTFLSSRRHVSYVYSKYGEQADICITEAVMGLFDGSYKMEGSSASIAELLGIPVILVVNAKATAYSVAPLIYGFKHFYPGIHIAGVIFNFVKSESHYTYLKAAAEDAGISSLGFLPGSDSIKLPSRHLGLTLSGDYDYNTLFTKMADHVEKHLDIEQLLNITNCSFAPLQSQNHNEAHPPKNRTIAVARDEAFNFLYHENLEMLRSYASLTFFSPLHDTHLPPADMVYLAGGYPECYVDQLAQNIPVKNEIKAFANSGGKILAECGGMMYMGQELIDKQGTPHEMVGFFDFSTSMQEMKLHLGYRKLSFKHHELRGHEFHYSRLIEGNNYSSIGPFLSSRNKEVNTYLYKKQQAIVTYVHFYWGADPFFFDLLYNE